VFSLAMVALDIQILLGMVLWIANRGWELGAFRAWVHPAGMLIALGVGQALLGRAKRCEGVAAYRFATLGVLLTLAIVAASIPRDAWSF
jgi:hypothetical protein